MNAKQHIWQSWADTLHRWGLSRLAASLLDAGGPITFLAAQMMYIGQPLLFRSVHPQSWQALTQMLEDADETGSFITLLREDALT